MTLCSTMLLWLTSTGPYSSMQVPWKLQHANTHTIVAPNVVIWHHGPFICEAASDTFSSTVHTSCVSQPADLSHIKRCCATGAISGTAASMLRQHAVNLLNEKLSHGKAQPAKCLQYYSRCERSRTAGSATGMLHYDAHSCCANFLKLGVP